MERMWVFDRLAISVLRIDFIDPAVAHEPDARERGVRIEVRPVDTDPSGSVYASWTRTIRPGICRIDLLESAPGAADRMHWHPDMSDGEPGGRTFDTDMPPDPVGWLTTFLRDGLADHLARARVTTGELDLGRDVEGIRDAAEEIGVAVAIGLAWAREPWPEVDHDARGMAVALPGA
jgi:hypothetical protein